MVSQPQMSAWCRRYGIYGSRSAPSPRKIPPPARAWLESRLHLTLMEIAAEAGTSPTVVSRWLTELGLTRANHGHPIRERVMRIIAPDGRADQARAWLAARATVPVVEIAAELGVSENPIYLLMQEFGVTYLPARRERTRGVGSAHERWARGEEWAQRDCPQCPYQAECRVLQRAGRRVRCESVDVESEQVLEGKERVSA
jgi:AraC-like DNA-binding protein